MSEPLQMRTYECVLVSMKNKDHKLPLVGVTKQELQLLAFIHGVDCVPVDSIKPLGTNPVRMGRTPEGEPIYVKSEMDEYMRLATKYDQFVNPGRGKKYVEDCFKVTLGGFDAILSEINALEAMDAAVNKVDKDAAVAALKEGAGTREAIEAEAKARAESDPPVGARVFGRSGAQA